MLPVPRRDESFLRTAGRMELMSESRKDGPPGSPESTVERTSAPVTGARGWLSQLALRTNTECVTLTLGMSLPKSKMSEGSVGR